MIITNWKACLIYLTNPRFLIGLMFDLLVSPLTLVLYLLVWLFEEKQFNRNVNLDSWFGHDTSKPPILLFHGSGSTNAQWLFARYLYLQKYYNVYSVNYNSRYTNIQSIEELATESNKKLQDIINAYNPTTKVTLLGMSMGGLVASYVAETFRKNSSNINRVITIGTPHRGAPALRFINIDKPRLSQMCPESEFIRSHQNRLQETKHRYVCLGSWNDIQVPYNYATIDNAEKHEHFFGHVSVLVFPSIWKTLFKYYYP